jgi:hypothetical protein
MQKPAPFREYDSPRSDNCVHLSQRVTHTVCGVGMPVKTENLRARFNPLLVGLGIVSPFMHVPNMKEQPISKLQGAEMPSGKNPEDQR